MKKLTKELFDEFESKYSSDPKNEMIENAISNVGIKEASKSKHRINEHIFIFNEEIDPKNITDQKKTGRCWMFAALNMARVKMMKDLNMEEFELSQTYLYFFDNMEKTNTFLDRIIKTKHLDINSREVIRALQLKTDDGGYFEYFMALIKKYGIVPKTAMSETFDSSDSTEMFRCVERIIKKAAMEIRRSDDQQAYKIKKDCLEKVYNIFVKCIGMPVKEFDFEYYDKDKKYHVDEKLTPLTFYEKYIGDFYDNCIRLINDPRERHPYGRVYVMTDVHNIVEMDEIIGLNVPTHEMQRVMIETLKDKKTAWYACDVSNMSDREAGIMDQHIYNFDETLIPLGEFSKADRLDSRETYPTHAMNITGVNLKDGIPTQWKVENSWGEKYGKKGVYSMSNDWFDEYVFELIVDKKYVDKKYLEGYEKPYIHYDPYDALCQKVTNLK